MAVYTVYVRGDLPTDRERAVFVREGFSWGAFWLGPFWLLLRGLWLALAAWVVVAIIMAWTTPHLSAFAALLLSLAVAIFVALEANRWRRGKLVRKGYTLREVVAAKNRDEAENRFFTGSNDGPPPPPSMSVPPSATPLASHAPPVMHEPGVLGLFPDPNGSR